MAGTTRKLKTGSRFVRGAQRARQKKARRAQFHGKSLR